MVKKNMKTVIKQRNPHTWFFAHMKTIDGYGQGYDDEIKGGIISHYSGGKTESLSELYEKHPTLYRKMKRDLMPAKSKRSDDPLDLPRKRLMAAIFEKLENQEKDKPQSERKKFDTNYVKSVACKAAKAARFNDIPLPTLKSLYRKFGELNQKEWGLMVKELFESAI